MQRILSLGILAIALSAAPTHAGHDGDRQPSVDISGSYTSNWGAVTLRQNGTRVTGSYVYQDGRIEGVIEGNLIRYTWREHDSTGHGVFVAAGNGELIGTWGVGTDDLSGGGWRLSPTRGTAIARAN